MFPLDTERNVYSNRGCCRQPQQYFMRSFLFNLIRFDAFLRRIFQTDSSAWSRVTLLWLFVDSKRHVKKKKNKFFRSQSTYIRINVLNAFANETILVTGCVVKNYLTGTVLNRSLLFCKTSDRVLNSTTPARKNIIHFSTCSYQLAYFSHILDIFS